MAITAKHKLTYGTDAAAVAFYLLAPPNHYTGIEAETGVVKLEDGSDELDMPICKTGELTLSPIAARKTLRVAQSSGKNKYVDIVVSASKVAGLDSALQGKAYKGGTITRVLDPRKATRY